MSRRSNSLRAAPVSLFPFLAVLICTMGTLIVLLVVVVQQAQIPAETADLPETPQADAQSAEPAEPTLPVTKPTEEVALPIDRGQERESLQMALEDARWAHEQLVVSRENTRQRMEDRRGELSRAEDQVRTLSARLDMLEKQASDLLATEAGKTLGDETLDDELAALRIQIKEAEQEIVNAQERLERGKRQYALIPYEGPYGTKRRPIYIECRSDLVILQPDGVAFGVDDLTNVGPDNPLAIALRAIREYLSDAGVTNRVGEPYPLLIVRPGGAGAYSACRNALSGWDDEYGYELLPDEMELTFPPVDETLGRVVRNAVDQARALAGIQPPGMAPGLAAGDPPPGNSSRKGGGGNDPLALGGNAAFPAAGPSGTGTDMGTDMGTGTGRGPATGAGSSDVGADPFGHLASDTPGGADYGMTAASSGAGQGGGGGNGTSSELAQQGGRWGTGSSSSTPSAAASGSRGDGAGGSPAAGRTSAFPTHDQAVADRAAGPGGPDILPPPDGVQLGGESHNVPPGGGPSGTPGNPGMMNQLAGNAVGSGAASSRSGQGTSSSDDPSAGGSGSFGMGSQGAPSSSGQPPPQGFSIQMQPDGTPSTEQRSVQSLAKTQGDNWALPNAARGAIGISRPIRVRCAKDSVALLPDSGAGRGVAPIGFQSSIRDAIPPLVSNIWSEIDRWGIAGPGVYWKPILQVTVEPGAEPQFAEMAELLRDSGLEIRRR